MKTPEYYRAYRAKRKAEGNPCASGPPGINRPSGPSGRTPRLPFGVDGEGVTDKNGNHRYVMLTYADETGLLTDAIEAPLGERLTTRECLGFLWQMFLDHPHGLFFGFSLGYDWTKIFEDVSDEGIYKLYRPELRKNMKGGHGRKWGIKFEEWVLNKDGPQVVTITKPGYRPDVKEHRKQLVIWDEFRFFAKSFVKAVGPASDGGWDIASPAELEFLKKMKDRRSLFRDEERDEMRRYNVLECKLLARTMRKVIDSHENLRTPSLPQGLTLKRYDGPGSTVSALFEAWELKPMFKELRKTYDAYSKAFQKVVASCMFGGRFEHRLVGLVVDGKYFDINSAYPAEICQLPCLLHGEWKHTRKEPGPDDIAMIRYRLLDDKKPHYWGPFPFREKDGSICFPIASDGGWVWNLEYQAAKRTGFWPGIRFREAWVFEKTCNCPPPFHNVAELYMRRDEVGKDSGEGQTLKLGMNSSYGKMAQSVGRDRGGAPFNCWFYAGMITAGTRAKLLDLMAVSGERSLLATATDGVLVLDKLDPPPPPETAAKGARKPLGGWGLEGEGGTQFLVRPGISVGTTVAKDGTLTKKTKARGIGKAELEEYGHTIQRVWQQWRYKKNRADAIFMLPSISRFVGINQGVRFNARSGEYVRDEKYGKWIERPQMMSFKPGPKRSTLESNGEMALRRIPHGVESEPYSKAILSPESEALLEAQRESEDQPDQEEGDWDDGSMG